MSDDSFRAQADSSMDDRQKDAVYRAIEEAAPGIWSGDWRRLPQMSEEESRRLRDEWIRQNAENKRSRGATVPGAREGEEFKEPVASEQAEGEGEGGVVPGYYSNGDSWEFRGEMPLSGRVPMFDVFGKQIGTKPVPDQPGGHGVYMTRDGMINLMDIPEFRKMLEGSNQSRQALVHWEKIVRDNPWGRARNHVQKITDGTGVVAEIRSLAQAKQHLAKLKKADSGSGNMAYWYHHGEAPKSKSNMTAQEKLLNYGVEWPEHMSSSFKKYFQKRIDEGTLQHGASYRDRRPSAYEHMGAHQKTYYVFNKHTGRWFLHGKSLAEASDVTGVMNSHTQFYRGLGKSEKRIYKDLRKLYESRGERGKIRFAQLSKAGMLSLSGNKVLSPIDLMKHNSWLRNNELDPPAWEKEKTPGEEVVDNLPDDPVVDPGDPVVDPGDPVVDPGDPVDSTTGQVSWQDVIAENVIRGDQQDQQVDQVEQVDQSFPDVHGDPVGQVDQEIVEDVIRDDQQGQVEQQVPDKLVEDANGNRFMVKADGTTYNMNNEPVDPVQGTEIATWDPTQGWVNIPARDDDDEATLAENMGLENAIEVSTPLSWDEVTRPRIDPGWAQRRVNVEYEQARQNIEQSRRDQEWGGRGMSTGLGTEYAHMVDPFVQSMTGARQAEAMIPYQTALENEAWRRGLSDQQFQQMLGLAGVTADDWYKRAFRAQEFQRITDAMMNQFASPLLNSLLGSVFSGPEGMSMMENVMPGVQTALGQSFNPSTVRGTGYGTIS